MSKTFFYLHGNSRFMSFFEYNENYYQAGNNSSDWFKYVSPLIGVVVGFVLSQIASWLTRRRKRNRLGKQYEYHIRILKQAITVNIEEYSLFISNYANDVQTRMGVASLKEHLHILKSIDILELQEYIRSKSGQKESDKIHRYMSTVNFVDYTDKKLEEEIDNAVALLNENGRELKRAFEKVGISIIRAEEQHRIGKGGNSYLDKIIPIAKDAFMEPLPESNYWEKAEAAMNKIIGINGKHTIHPFAKTLDDLFADIIPKLKTFLAEREHHISTLEQTIKTLNECKKNLPTV